MIWPDNDEPGRAYALEAAALALKAGASSVRIVELPDGLPEGWDLADPVPDGMELDYASLIAEAPKFDPDGEEQGTFRVQWRKAGKLMPGMHFRCLDKDPETGEPEPGWHWFGSRLDVLGYTRDGENREWGRYLAVHDSDGKVHHIAMPMATMAGDGTEYRRELLRHGFILAPGKTAREQLDIYLSMWRPKRRLRCVDRIGWHGSRFVLPDRTFGPGGETVVLQASRPAKFTVAGSLAEWKRLVAAPAAGNSRLAFAIAASFAGPLLHLLARSPAASTSGAAPRSARPRSCMRRARPGAAARQLADHGQRGRGHGGRRLRHAAPARRGEPGGRPRGRRHGLHAGQRHREEPRHPHRRSARGRHLAHPVPQHRRAEPGRQDRRDRASVPAPASPCA